MSHKKITTGEPELKSNSTAIKIVKSSARNTMANMPISLLSSGVFSLVSSTLSLSLLNNFFTGLVT